jgi:hypothetical protein
MASRAATIARWLSVRRNDGKIPTLADARKRPRRELTLPLRLQPDLAQAAKVALSLQPSTPKSSMHLALNGAGWEVERGVALGCRAKVE